jgi:uncharacterized oxidoreductase
MKLNNQTILITGGSSGIGLELARQLVLLGNNVIICGRTAAKLAEAKSLVPQLDTYACDISDDRERQKLVEWLMKHYPRCNVLINNAAIVHRTNFHADNDMALKSIAEINTNLVSPIVLTKMLLSRLAHQSDAAIINITTGLVYAPRAVYPIYNATKAALHSFSQVLRKQLQGLSIEVIEVMMPVVDTPWHQGNVPKIAISPEDAVNAMIRQLKGKKQEIRIGKVRLLYVLSRIMPALAFKMINRVS